jgi:hypothetical protein
VIFLFATNVLQKTDRRQETRARKPWMKTVDESRAGKTRMTGSFLSIGRSL